MADLHILAVVYHHTPLPSQWLTPVYFLKSTTPHPYLFLRRPVYTRSSQCLAPLPQVLHGWPLYVCCNPLCALTFCITDLCILSVVLHPYLLHSRSTYTCCLYIPQTWPPYTFCNALQLYNFTFSMAGLRILAVVNHSSALSLPHSSWSQPPFHWLYNWWICQPTYNSPTLSIQLISTAIAIYLWFRLTSNTAKINESPLISHRSDTKVSGRC